MNRRHLMMISFGGVIGTGLFLSTGYTINQAGPLGTVLAYSIGAVIVYLVMMCLGELSVAMPFTGAFHVYARQYLGPATGFVTAVLYWLTWTVALGSEFTGAAMIMYGWFPGVPVWVWAAAFITLVLVLNMVSVKVFAEAETLLSGIKVVAIILFIVLGTAAIIGLLPYEGHRAALGLTNLYRDGLFPNSFGAVFTTILAVNFAFSGTELIGITAGEVEDPGTTIPRAIRATLARLVIFFIGSIVIIAALIPWKEAGVEESPFVTVLSRIGVPYAGDLMNVVILAAILSAANSGLYASTRMLWSLANEGTLPKVLARTNRFGVPALAMGLSMVGGLAALLTSAYAASTVYLVLVSVSGLAVVLVWVVIAAAGAPGAAALTTWPTGLPGTPGCRSRRSRCRRHPAFSSSSTPSSGRPWESPPHSWWSATSVTGGPTVGSAFEGGLPDAPSFWKALAGLDDLLAEGETSDRDELDVGHG